MAATQFLTILLLLGIMILGAFSGSCLTNSEQEAKLRELQSLAKETEIYPGFKRIDYSDTRKHEGIVIPYFYRSSANYEDVKSFYTKTLLAKGWKLQSEAPVRDLLKRVGNRLTFEKGNHRIHIEHVGGGSDYQYAVDFAWAE